MRNNRKKADTYRFNGLWGIRSADIVELKSMILKFERKLTDPGDPDDRKWTTQWLQLRLGDRRAAQARTPTTGNGQPGGSNAFDGN